MIRKFFICIFIVSIFLGYVAQKVNLVRLSYEIDRKEKIRREFLEEQKHLKFKVSYLKSPKRLDALMEAAKINFQLPREIRIVKVEPNDFEPSDIVSLPTEEKFGNWLNWIKEAQAKTTRS